MPVMPARILLGVNLGVARKNFFTRNQSGAALQKRAAAQPALMAARVVKASVYFRYSF